MQAQHMPGVPTSEHVHVHTFPHSIKHWWGPIFMVFVANYQASKIKYAL